MSSDPVHVPVIGRARLPVYARRVALGFGCHDGTMSDEHVDHFIENGFVHLREVVAPDVVAAGQKIIWSDLGQSADDPSSWTGPVARIIPSDARPFRVAFDSPPLFDAFDRLVGRGRWLSRPDLGYFVVRFPHPADPGDTGWHIDSSFPPADADADAGDFSQWRVNVSSRGRALLMLMLFLFSDVGPDDAPTRIKVGSHLDVPPLLRAAGTDGMTGTEASALAARASASRAMALATGRAGEGSEGRCDRPGPFAVVAPTYRAVASTISERDCARPRVEARPRRLMNCNSRVRAFSADGVSPWRPAMSQ